MITYSGLNDGTTIECGVNEDGWLNFRYLFDHGAGAEEQHRGSIHVVDLIRIARTLQLVGEEK